MSCSSLVDMTVFVSTVVYGQVMQVHIHAKDVDVSSSRCDSSQEQLK